MTMINNLFANNTNEVAASGNALNKTAQLTAIATEVANSVFKTLTTNMTEAQAALDENDATNNANGDREQIVENNTRLHKAFSDSQVSHDVMDQLIADNYDLQNIDIEFLKNESDDTLDKMLKSQQSKRSRTKSKAMTQENYITLIVAGVAENLLRMAAGKSKTGGGGKRTEVAYTDEQLQKLAANQEDLKKAIRNIQSKKCIMKSKANFNETSDEWQQLLSAEAQLKSIRVTNSGTTQTVVVKEADPEVAARAEKAQEVEEILKSVENIDGLKAADSKSLLNKIKDMLATR